MNILTENSDTLTHQPDCKHSEFNVSRIVIKDALYKVALFHQRSVLSGRYRLVDPMKLFIGFLLLSKQIIIYANQTIFCRVEC